MDAGRPPACTPGIGEAVLNAGAGSIEWARDQARQLWLWDTSEKQTIARAAMARGFGLDPLMFARGFPGSPPTQVTIVSQPQADPIPPEPRRPRSGIPPWARTAGLLLLVSMGSLLLGRVLTMPSPPAASVVSPPTGHVDDVELEVRWKLGDDGKWKTEVIPSKPK